MSFESSADELSPLGDAHQSELAAHTPSIDPVKASAVYAQLVRQQNLPLGVIGGLAAAIVGAAIWAGVTIATQYQIGWLAVGIGFLVGWSVRYLGKGLTKSFGIAGGLLALFGCVLGNFLAMCGLVAADAGQPIVDLTLAIASRPSVAADLMRATFSPMDLLFYGIAVFEGYKFSFREIQDHELEAMLG